MPTVYELLKLGLPKDLGANLRLSQKSTLLLNITESQIKPDMAEQQGLSEAVCRHALMLWAPSEHLIEFSHDKIPTFFLTFSPTHWEPSRGLYACLV